MEATLTFKKYLDLKVKDYFAKNKLQKSGGWYMVTKTIVLGILLVSSYTMMFLFPSVGWWALTAVIVSMLGFVAHDASHHAFTKKIKGNEIMVLFFDFIAAASSRLWYIQHIFLHHPSVNGVHDPDINKIPLIRLSRNQPYKPWYRYQKFYVLVLYSLSYLGWIFGDIKNYRKGMLHTKEVSFSKKEKRIFWFGKISSLSIFVVTPMIFLPTIYVLKGLVLYLATVGIFTTIIFQLAHAVREAAFETKEKDIWERQVLETVNFCPGNRWVNWITGGLSHQIEHHLFTNVSHQHYPDLVPIVKEACEKYGIEYKFQKSFWKAICSHFMLLHENGKNPEPNAT